MFRKLIDWLFRPRATQVKIFTSDDKDELAGRINEFLASRPCRKVRFVQIMGNGVTNYAMLVAWEETV